MARNVPERMYQRIAIELPAFAVCVFRKRAHDQSATVSALIERLVLEDVMVDEVQELAGESPEFAGLFAAWFRQAMARKK